MPYLRILILAALGCAAMAADKTAKRNPSASPAPSAPSAPAVPAAILGEVRKAQASFAEGDLAGAQRTYEQALTKAPENPYVLFNLGVVRLRRGYLAQAEIVLKQAVALAPNDDASHTTLGTVYLMQERYDDALIELDAALKLNPQSASAHCYKGVSASAKGQLGLARTELETALKLDPNLSDAHFNLAVFYATQQPPDKERALRHYVRAKELGAEPDPDLEKSLK